MTDMEIDCDEGKVAWYVPFSKVKLTSFTVVSTAINKLFSLVYFNVCIRHKVHRTHNTQSRHNRSTSCMQDRIDTTYSIVAAITARFERGSLTW